MISRETAFIDLTRPENLEKIDIDESLVPYFISVMQKMQTFFEKKGLIYANNYALLFQKFILTDFESNKISIKVGETKEASGNFNLLTKKITISDTLKNRKLEETLSHEFIHFLIMATAPFVENSYGEFVQRIYRPKQLHFQYGPFLNEAVTEYINRQIYPESRFYPHHVKMLKFMQNIFDSEDDIFYYLRGCMPVDQNPLFDEFKLYVNKFQIISDYTKSNYNYAYLYKDENFMNAQKTLIKILKNILTKEIEQNKYENIVDYVQRVYKIKNSQPVESLEFLETYKEINLLFLEKYFNKKITSKAYQEHYLKLLDQTLDNYYHVQNNYITSYEMQVANSKIKIDMFKDEISFKFVDQKITFARNDIQDKLFYYKAHDKSGNEYNIDMLCQYDGDNVIVKFGEPISKEYNFDCNNKKLNYMFKNYSKNIERNFNEIYKEKIRLENLQKNQVNYKTERVDFIEPEQKIYDLEINI